MTAALCALLYLSMGGVWIFFSNHLLFWLEQSRQNAHQYQLLNAVIFILLTTILAYRFLSKKMESQQRLLEDLKKSEQKYRELIEHANSIILHMTHEGTIKFINEFGLRFFGYSEEEIVGRHIVGTLVPDTESTGRDLGPLLAQICANPAAFEHNINENMKRNGERVWIEWTNKVAFDEQGRVTGILSIGTDITERRRAETALRDSEARYRGLFEDCPTALWEEDFSELKGYLDGLRQSGVTDFRAYFNAHPDALRHCPDKIKVLDVNRATLDMLHYEHREDLCAHLSHIFREDSYDLESTVFTG